MVSELIGLKDKAQWVRQKVLEMIASVGKGHIGGSFSCVEILIALYYGDILYFNAKNPSWSERDRFILSKGHACATLYTILADLGFFPISELASFNREGSRLEGHPNRDIPGVEVTTGSLGHGLGIAAGLALSAKINKKDWITVVLLSDGELYEGSVWEAAMFASHHQLNNLVAIVDRNQQCCIDFTENFLHLNPLEDKWRAFGWDVITIDGHSFEELLSVFKELHSRHTSRPLAVIANTVKGKGVSFMERKIQWHNTVPKGEELEIAWQELAND